MTAITRDVGDYGDNLAGPLGFEPRQSAPKALDLPLVDGPVNSASLLPISRAGAPDGLAFPDHPITAISRSPDLPTALCLTISAEGVPPLGLD